MEKRYNESTKLRPQQAKQIPDLAVNFIDQNNEFADGFTTGLKKGDPTKFTGKALGYYDDELRQVTVPDGFLPTEQGIALNRWSPKTKYADSHRIPS
jgi:hypothetical protein